MKLSENDLGLEWLRQFDSEDVHAARFALDSLKLVSLSEFEASITRNVGRMIEELEGKIAVFPISKKIIDPSSPPGSECRLGHMLTGLSRAFPDRLLVSPSDESMEHEKVSDVILVDDFVASGSRLLEFWDAWKPKRLKSWLSFGYCKLWLVGYAIHREGLAAASRLHGLNSDRTVFDVFLEGERDYWPAPLIEFFERNAERTFHKPFSANFGGIRSPIVFQHGCPDNAPAVFCRNGPSFKALFPNRSIPLPLFMCFDDYTDFYRTPELLWKAGQPTLAIQALEAVSDTTSNFPSDILCTLGLLSRKLSPDKLPSLMTASAKDVSDRITACTNLGLLDGEAKVTPFGFDLLARARRKYLSSDRKESLPDDDAIYYIPEQFSGESCGVQ